MSELGLAVIGLRHLHAQGWIHNIAQTPGMRVAAVAEADAARLGRCAREHPQIPTCASVQGALAVPGVDVALILLPHDEMPGAALAAVAEGKHLIVEKPCAVSAAAFEPVAAAVAGRGVKFTTPYLWRYDPAVRRAAELIRQGAIGRPLYCTGRINAGGPHRYRALSDWMLQRAKSGGGALRNLGVHWIDGFAALLADEPQTVVAQLGGAAHGLEVEDHARALLEFSGGAQLLVETCYALPDSYPPEGYDYGFAIKGTEGYLEWSRREDTLLWCPGRGDPVVERLDRSGAAGPGPGYGGQQGLDFLRTAADAISEDREPEIRLADALRALRVVDAAYESAAQQRAVRLA